MKYNDNLHSKHDVLATLNARPKDTGIIICGHGSRAKIAEQEFASIVLALRARYPDIPIEYGFLEYSSPNIHMALDRLLAQGVRTIFAVPGMLFSATHAQNDIPSVLTTYRQKHAGLTIKYGKELGLHEQMIAAFQHRIMAAVGLDDMPDCEHEAGALYDTLLVVVGRGTSVATANAEAAKLTRIVAENMGFGWCETVYSGVTFPSVGRGLEMAVKLGFKRVVVAPYFLFSGRLIGRINAYVEKVAAENPHITFMLADYLRDQTHVIDTFVIRIAETISQPAHYDGLMEDFQARLAAGAVTAHHHHAEYQPEPDHNHPHSHDHNHSHSHAHAHAHARYRHIAHPHGPRSMIDDNVCCCFMSQFPESVIKEERKRLQEKQSDSSLPTSCADTRIPQCQTQK